MPAGNEQKERTDVSKQRKITQLTHHRTTVIDLNNIFHQCKTALLFYATKITSIINKTSALKTKKTSHQNFII